MKKNSESWLHLLAAAYIAATFFIMVLRFPAVGYKIQPAELAFLPLLAVCGFRYGRQLLPGRLGWLEWALLAYIASNFISAIGAGSFSALMDSLGRAYLVLVFYCFYTYARREGRRAVCTIERAFLFGGALSAAAGLAGWALAMAGYPNFAVRLYEDYPYLGTVYRTAAFTPGMSMLISLLLFPLLLAYARAREQGSRVYYGLFLLIAACALLNFSKTLLLAGLGLFLIRHKNLAKTKKAALVALAVCAFFFLSEWVLLPTEQAGQRLHSKIYSSGEAYGAIGGYTVIESSYLALQKAALALGLQRPLLGVGPGEFPRYLPKLKAQGLYPAHMPGFDPHSTWLGAFAELGTIGFLTVSFMAFCFFREISGAIRKDAFLLALSLFLLFTLAESLLLDVLNFRHLWVLLGCGLGVQQFYLASSEARHRIATN